MIQTPVEYEVGDIVQVKEWEEMAKEFGYCDDLRIIRTPHFLFLPKMRNLCGEVFEIRAKRMDNGMIVYRSVENIEDRGDGNHWLITAYMLKPASDSGSEFETDLDSWAALIGG